MNKSSFNGNVRKENLKLVSVETLAPSLRAIEAEQEKNYLNIPSYFIRNKEIF